tara:strand:+ start:433 stop:1113 length:681 start_codon:yes stop_codon:yes gene_type:complete
MIKKAICIIPARSKSKRIKNKNIILINKKPLIAHVIRNLKKSGCFKDIFVSTDSKKIQKISIKYGAKVPFIRSRKLSNDFSSIHQVVKDAVKKIKVDYKYDYVCYIFPTAILVSFKLIRKYYLQFIKSNKDFSINIKKFDHPIERAFKIKNKKLLPTNKKKFHLRTQDISESYYDSGEIYFAKKESFSKNKKLFKSKIKFIFSESKNVDLDNKKDLLKLKQYKKNY